MSVGGAFVGVAVEDGCGVSAGATVSVGAGSMGSVSVFEVSVGAEAGEVAPVAQATTMLVITGMAITTTRKTFDPGLFSLILPISSLIALHTFGDTQELVSSSHTDTVGYCSVRNSYPKRRSI